MTKILTCVVLLTLIIVVTANGAQKIAWDSPWTYHCVEDTMDGPACQRSLYNSSQVDGKEKMPLKSCILTCGRNGPLWPYPLQVELGKNLSSFTLAGIRVGSVSTPSDLITRRLYEATNLTLKYIQNMVPEDGENLRNRPFLLKIQDKDTDAVSNNTVEIHLVVKNSDEKITLDTDETYSLTINSTQGDSEGNPSTTVRVVITGNTYFGTRHGLETLSQLVAYNEETNLLQIVDTVKIEDEPVFRYRGALIDTARNFIPVDDLKKMIDGLSYNKLNMLHWHISDSNSFPFYSKRVPQMTRFGIVNARKVYTPEDVQELVSYALVRGVKIIPELDAPAHAGNGWQFGELEGLGELTLCLDVPLDDYRSYCIQPPCGQLNPLNNNTLFVLGELYKDFLDVFDTDLFHMGGDEVSEKCWLAYAPIQEWLNTHSGNLMDLWGLFQQQALEKLREADPSTTAIVWTSEMTNTGRRFLNTSDYIIQIWSQSNDPVIKDVLNEDYRVIFSHNDTVYLDHGFGPWRGVNYTASMKYWQTVYENDLLAVVETQVGKERKEKMIRENLILGGEATLFSEKADRNNMEMKLWPRSAAMAERLWSNPPANRTRFAYPRLIHHRERMVERGIQVDTLLPESCYHTWGFCDIA